MHNLSILGRILFPECQVCYWSESNMGGSYLIQLNMCLYSFINLHLSRLGFPPCSHPILTSETTIRIDVRTENQPVEFPPPVVSHNTGLSYQSQRAVSPHAKIRPNTAYFWCCACLVVHYFWYWCGPTKFTSRRKRFLLFWSANPLVAL
jgi:hypothetical protein